MKTATLKDRKYAQRARRRFCGNSRTTPFELVLSGQRSLEEWIEVLAEERTRREDLSRNRPASPRDHVQMVDGAGQQRN